MLDFDKTLTRYKWETQILYFFLRKNNLFCSHFDYTVSYTVMALLLELDTHFLQFAPFKQFFLPFFVHKCSLNSSFMIAVCNSASLSCRCASYRATSAAMTALCCGVSSAETADSTDAASRTHLLFSRNAEYILPSEIGFWSCATSSIMVNIDGTSFSSMSTGSPEATVDGSSAVGMAA